MLNSHPPRRLLVTGAASGMGAACVRLAVEKGWRVHGVDIEPAPPDSDAHEWSRVDLADTASRSGWISEMVDRADNIGGAILAAGVMNAEAQDGWDEPVWRRTLEIDLVAPAHLVFGLGSIWSAHAGIVLFGSIAASDGTLGSPAYAAAKAGLVGVMGAAIRRFADREVRVNVVHPGSVDTPLSRRMLEELPESVRARMPTLNRAGMPPENVSRIAVELVEAYGISGKAIRVDRGARIVPGVSPGPLPR